MSTMCPFRLASVLVADACDCAPVCGYAPLLTAHVDQDLIPLHCLSSHVLHRVYSQVSCRKGQRRLRYMVRFVGCTGTDRPESIYHPALDRVRAHNMLEPVQVSVADLRLALYTDHRLHAQNRQRWSHQSGHAPARDPSHV